MAGTTLHKGAGWPWEGGRRGPTARPPTPERFDAYVSVRSGADLGNKANLNSPEQVTSSSVILLTLLEPCNRLSICAINSTIDDRHSLNSKVL